MAALLNYLKQAWTSVTGAFKGCCGKTEEAPATTTLEISTAPDGEVIIGTEKISHGGGGKTNADLLGLDQLDTSSGSAEPNTDLLATSMISSGGGGKTN